MCCALGMKPLTLPTKDFERIFRGLLYSLIKTNSMMKTLLQINLFITIGPTSQGKVVLDNIPRVFQMSKEYSHVTIRFTQLKQMEIVWAYTMSAVFLWETPR
jgi:hypothetical protein